LILSVRQYVDKSGEIKINGLKLVGNQDDYSPQLAALNKKHIVLPGDTPPSCGRLIHLRCGNREI